jgi:hypothetical protein
VNNTEQQWEKMGIDGKQWETMKTMVSNGKQWETMENNGKQGNNEK